MALCLADVDQWSLGEIGSVFGVCINVADQCFTLSDTLTNLRAFSTWTGEAADARAVEQEVAAIKKQVAGGRWLLK